MQKIAGIGLVMGWGLLLAPLDARAEADEPPPVTDVERTDEASPQVAEPAPPASSTESERAELKSAELEPAEPTSKANPPTAFAPAAQAGDMLSTFGLHIGAGFSFGGDELATVTYSDGSTSTLYAGQAIYVGGGITWTPLWPTDRIGLGLGYDVGYKLGTTFSNSDGTIEMERIPMVLSLRGLVAIGGNYHFLLAAGGVAEFGPHMYGTGVANVPDTRFSDAFGGMVEAGILFGAPLAVGGEITGRFTGIEYSSPGYTASGVSGGVNFALHFFL